MKVLGIIGGIAPGSTIEYYRLLIETFRERTDGAYPPVIIDSIDLTRMMGFVSAGRLEALTGYLLSELERLARAGAQVALLASNTPHLVFDALRERAPLPLISSFYTDVFARAGTSVVVPREDEQAYTHDVYMNELVNGVFRDESRDGIDGVILGGTELPLLIRPEDQVGVPFLDTTRIHVGDAPPVILSREDGEGSQDAHPKILRFAQDDGAQSRPSVASAFS